MNVSGIFRQLPPIQAEAAISSCRSQTATVSAKHRGDSVRLATLPAPRNLTAWPGKPMARRSPQITIQAFCIKSRKVVLPCCDRRQSLMLPSPRTNRLPLPSRSSRTEGLGQDVDEKVSRLLPVEVWSPAVSKLFRSSCTVFPTRKPVRKS